MGQLFRSFWLPALPSAQLGLRDGTPVRLKILGENLLAFRDSSGKVGIVEPNCPHRGAPLYLGRNEDCGLRCLYHGWKFDVHGKCIDMPNIADSGKARQHVSIRSYRTREAGGVIWIYMGPAGEIPQPPHFEWLDLSAKRRHVSVWLQESNWLRGLEGEMDPSHVSFLHSSEQRSVSAHRIISITERSPEVFVRNTPYGIMCIARRDAGEQGYYWRISKWLAPSYSMIPSAAGLLNGRMWVPIDDSHSYCWHYAYRLDRDISDAELAQLESGLGFPPQSVLQRFALNNGDCIDTWVPVRNRRNGYLADRALQSAGDFTGIKGANDQDRAVQEEIECAGARVFEHLVDSDQAIIAVRKYLRGLTQGILAGNRPRAAVHGEWYRTRPLDLLSPLDDVDELLSSVRASMEPDAEKTVAEEVVTPAVGAEVRTLMENIEKAIVEANLPLLDSVYCERFSLVHGTGVRNSKEAWLQSVLKDKGKYVSRVLEAADVELHGDVALASGRITVRKQDTELREYSFEFVRVFRQVSGAWRMLSHRTTSECSIP